MFNIKTENKQNLIQMLVDMDETLQFTNPEPKDIKCIKSLQKTIETELQSRIESEMQTQ